MWLIDHHDLSLRIDRCSVMLSLLYFLRRHQSEKDTYAATQHTNIIKIVKNIKHLKRDEANSWHSIIIFCAAGTSVLGVVVAPVVGWIIFVAFVFNSQMPPNKIVVDRPSKTISRNANTKAFLSSRLESPTANMPSRRNNTLQINKSTDSLLRSSGTSWQCRSTK